MAESRNANPPWRVKAALLGLLLASPAWAHGDASWIMEGDTLWCCGPTDCGPIEASEVQPINNNSWKWRGVVFTKGDGKTFPTQPLKIQQPEQRWEYWGCQPEGQSPKCFFYPPEAF